MSPVMKHPRGQDADDHKLFDTENNANARAFLEAYLEEYKEEMGIRLPEEG